MTTSPPGPSLLGLFSLLSVLGGIGKEERCVPFACKGRVKEQKDRTTPLGSMSLGLFGGELRVSASLACNAASAGVWKAVSRTLALSQLGPFTCVSCCFWPAEEGFLLASAECLAKAEAKCKVRGV